MTGPNFPALLEAFFSDRLILQRSASRHTVAAYRDTFRLLLQFARKDTGKQPSALTIGARVESALGELTVELIARFLDSLERNRNNAARSRNLRLAAIRSFFRYAALECPDHSSQIQRVLAIPPKRYSRRLVDFLTAAEITALLAVPDQTTWLGRRDRTLLLVAIQTGLRLSEITSLRQENVELGRGASVRCEGKGRKHRCTPLIKSTAKALKGWISEQGQDPAKCLFPSRSGGPLSPDTVQYLVSKYAAAAMKTCPSLRKKRVTPHVLRHTAAMELMQSGADRSLISLWLGHESLETTQIYLDANLALKEEALKKMMPRGVKVGRYKPGDQLLAFLKNL